MTMGELMQRIENIPVVEQYTDKQGQYIGKTLTRWIDVKAKVIEILKEYEKEREVKDDEPVSH